MEEKERVHSEDVDSKESYQEYVEYLAEVEVRETENPEEKDPHDMAFVAVDTGQMMNGGYGTLAMIVCEWSEYEPQSVGVGGPITSTVDIMDCLKKAAFDCMKQDVAEKIRGML